MTKAVWYPVVKVPLEQDLKPFLDKLKELGLPHHVTEEEGQQQLWISSQEHVLEVANTLTMWLNGELTLAPIEPHPQGHQQQTTSFSTIFRLQPLTLILITLGLAGAILFKLDPEQLSYIRPFLFQGIQGANLLTVNDSLSRGEYWRLLTPIFLHFSWLHFIFNSLIIWELGRRFEIAKGSVVLAIMVLIIGIGSNISQYVVSGPNIFGGLSGVAYGLIGCIAIYQQCIPHPILQFNKAAIVFFIGWLVLGVLGIIDFFISGSIANTAHIAGLLLGAVIGLIMVIIDKSKTKQI